MRAMVEETRLTACRIIGADRERTSTSRFPIHLPFSNPSPLFGDCAASHAALLICTESAAAVVSCSPTNPVAMAI